MKYVLMFVGSTEDQDRWEAQTPEELAASYAKVNDWFERYGKSGKIVGGEELQGPSNAAKVTRKNGKVTVIDGPFIESKEIVGGFAIVDVKDREEAIAIAGEWPGGPVEVRAVVDHSQEH